jgi:hypothetical protein
VSDNPASALLSHGLSLGIFVPPRVFGSCCSRLPQQLAEVLSTVFSVGSQFENTYHHRVSVCQALNSIPLLPHRIDVLVAMVTVFEPLRHHLLGKTERSKLVLCRDGWFLFAWFTLLAGTANQSYERASIPGNEWMVNEAIAQSGVESPAPLDFQAIYRFTACQVIPVGLNRAGWEIAKNG